MHFWADTRTSICKKTWHMIPKFAFSSSQIEGDSEKDKGALELNALIHYLPIQKHIRRGILEKKRQRCPSTIKDQLVMRFSFCFIARPWPNQIHCNVSLFLERCYPFGTNIDSIHRCAYHRKMLLMRKRKNATHKACETRFSTCSKVVNFGNIWSIHLMWSATHPAHLHICSPLSMLWRSLIINQSWL
jgi:hypothetical protein